MIITIKLVEFLIIYIYYKIKQNSKMYNLV